MDWDIVEQILGQILAFEEPDAAHVFDVPAVPDEPSEEDVRRATERLIALESVAATIPDKLRALDDLTSTLTLRFNMSAAEMEQYEAVEAGWSMARSLRDAWLDYQQLVMQQIGHWQAAVAVMEHDIAWQQTALALRSASFRRPRPAAALTVATESWRRCTLS